MKRLSRSPAFGPECPCEAVSPSPAFGPKCPREAVESACLGAFANFECGIRLEPHTSLLIFSCAFRARGFTNKYRSAIPVWSYVLLQFGVLENSGYDNCNLDPRSVVVKGGGARGSQALSEHLGSSSSASSCTHAEGCVGQIVSCMFALGFFSRLSPASVSGSM